MVPAGRIFTGSYTARVIKLDLGHIPVVFVKQFPAQNCSLGNFILNPLTN